MNIETDVKLDYLNNGSAVIIRRLSESDRSKLLDGFDALSQLSRYRRFLHNKNELKQAEIECLFNMPMNRGVSYIALECIDVHTHREGRCIGLIQLIELESKKAGAEVALVVIDEFHNCGLGKRLLETIYTQAQHRNLDTLYFYTTSDNKPLSAILERIGWDICVDREFGSLTISSTVQTSTNLNATRHGFSEHIAQTVNRAHGIQNSHAHRRQILSGRWFSLYLRIIVLMNQFYLSFYKRTQA